MIGILNRYVRKALSLGPRKTVHVVRNKLNGKLFSWCWRRKALRREAAHSWTKIRAKHNASDFDDFFKNFQHTKFNIVSFLTVPLSKNEPIFCADKYVSGAITVLGSAFYQNDSIPWHDDIRLKQQNPHADYRFSSDKFYQDIAIQTGETDQLSKDIKVPWELSRCQEFLWLGQAYAVTGDKKYAQKFEMIITDWLDVNPYMLGVNWLCPMEVGLRALNWVIAFAYFKQESTISTDFWQRFVESLYDHFFYLENNWEIYDGRTSNHYLSDLVGYFYVCSFFENLSGVKAKLYWCFEQILTECEKQVFNEGTSYEGSTTYHRLVTELFVHAYLLAREHNIKIPDLFVQKLRRMLEFIDWCTPQDGSIVTIGDHDSGCVTRVGITQKMRDLLSPEKAQGTKLFKEFGLSVIKTPAWHITLRHHAYQQQQPSGHFHNDVGSVTLAINGIPVIADPGSYVYTPSRTWRNYFRSAAAHSMMYVEGYEPVPFDDRLFALALPEQRIFSCEAVYNPCGSTMLTTNGLLLNTSYGLKTQHNLYERYGIALSREINLSDDAKIFCIKDSYIISKKHSLPSLFLISNFVLGPNISVKTIVPGKHFKLLHLGQSLVEFKSELVDFEITQCWNSSGYGEKEEVLCLRARMPVHENGSYAITVISPQ